MQEIFNANLGSHAYGTNTSTSDMDYRGIFVNSMEENTPFFYKSHFTDNTKKDSMSYEIGNFLKMYSNGNPNIIELLWVDEGNILYADENYELLRKNRVELLTTKVAHSFAAYGLSQMKQMRSQNKFENNPQSIEPPRQIDYVKMVVNFTPDKSFSINLEDYHKHHRLVHYGGHIYGLYSEHGYSPFNDKNFNLNVNSDEFEHTTLDGQRKTPSHIVKFNIEEYKRDLEV